MLKCMEMGVEENIRYNKRMEKINLKKVSSETRKIIKQQVIQLLKKSRQFFVEELLLYFDIKENIIAFAPTELVRLELQKCRKKITDENGT